MLPFRARDADEFGLGSLLRPLYLLKAVVFASFFLALWAVFNHQALKDYFTATVHRDENARAVAELERRRAELQKEKEQLESWGFPAEKAIRERFMMALPGEKVIIIEEPPSVGSDFPAMPDARASRD